MNTRVRNVLLALAVLLSSLSLARSNLDLVVYPDAGAGTCGCWAGSSAQYQLFASANPAALQRLMREQQLKQNLEALGVLVE